nr:MAG TPA: hypothetical protein [Caudoviricetes sp.]
MLDIKKRGGGYSASIIILFLSKERTTFFLRSNSFYQSKFLVMPFYN